MTNFISKDLAVKIAKQTINIRGEGDQTYAQLSGK
jgi:hypothetical protein